MVLAVGQGDTPQAEVALDRLCQAYWYPVYAFIRRHGHPTEEARDLTQEFFARMILHRSFGKADAARGRFRAFLLASVRNFLSDAWDKATAQKRGGGVLTISLEDLGSWERWVAGPDDHLTPDAVYDRSWAHSVLRHTFHQLRDEYVSAGRGDRFDALEAFLPERLEEPNYHELSQRLGLTEAAVRSEVHRILQRFRTLLRREVAHTVSTPEDIDDELRNLMLVVAQ
jgi:RNA polymerase sigma-70 factor (ECF subfamily)